ncbi:uncharacterized protein LOC144988965 [Oryzias latipes]
MSSTELGIKDLCNWTVLWLLGKKMAEWREQSASELHRGKKISIQFQLFAAATMFWIDHENLRLCSLHCQNPSSSTSWLAPYASKAGGGAVGSLLVMPLSSGSTYKLDRGIGKVMPVPRVQEKQLQEAWSDDGEGQEMEQTSGPGFF